MKLKLYELLTIATLLSLIFLVSCSEGESLTTEIQFINAETYDDVEVLESNLPLFADLSVFLKTKSLGTESLEDIGTVSLESLIDRNRTISKMFRQYILTEIPFRSNESPSFAIINGSDGIRAENFTEISNFFCRNL